MKHHKKLVVVMFENRSFDNLCGYFDNPNLDNLINRKKKLHNSTTKGKKIFTSQGHESELKFDPGEDYKHVAVQMGKIESDGTYPMNGFVQDYEGQIPKIADPSPIMCSIDPSRIPIFHSLANAFVLCDKWFSAVPTQTYPNRFALHTGMISDQLTNEPYVHWVKQTTPTLFDQMSEQNLDWGIYFDGKDVIPLTWMIHHQSLKKHDKQFHHHSQLFQDFKNNTLPSYSFVQPRFIVSPSDYHPLDYDNMVPFHNTVQASEAFLNDVYNAWRTSPGRDDILLLITFDEHGGLYDHVSPPDGLGVRVPAVFISTHIKPDYLQTHACSSFLQHMSILRTIHDWLNLPLLSEKEKKANGIPDSIFTEKVTLPLEKLPVLEVLDEKHSPLELLEYPIQSTLGKIVVQHFAYLFKKDVSKHLSANESLKCIQEELEKQQWFSHLYPKTIIQKNKKAFWCC